MVDAVARGRPRSVRSVEPSSMISHSTTSKPGDLAREVGQRCRERRLLVEAGDLDDELHARRAGATGRAERSTPYTRWRPVSHMASATITRPAPGPDPAAGRRSRRRSWPVLALVALALGTLVGFLVYPTYPNYDSYYSLLWGRELLHGVKPSFDGYRTPTEHPLAVAFGALLSLVGDPADRIMVGATLASFVVLAAGLYRLARGVVRAARRPRRRRAAVHALRLPVPGRARLHRHPVPGLRRVGRGARGRAPAARHASSSCCWPAPGCMRPEAWLLSGLYFLWCVLARRPGRSASATRCSPRSPPVIWTRARLVGDRRPEVLADPHQRPGRGARAHQRRAVRRAQHDA